MSIRRKVIASLFFLLAALLAIHVGTGFYFERENPTSTSFIRNNLNSPAIAKRFKVEEAKSAGYTEDEIAKHLSQENSAATERSMKTLLLIEATIFAVALLIGLGILVLNPRSAKPNHEQESA